MKIFSNIEPITCRYGEGKKQVKVATGQWFRPVKEYYLDKRDVYVLTNVFNSGVCLVNPRAGNTWTEPRKVINTKCLSESEIQAVFGSGVVWELIDNLLGDQQ